MTQRFHSLTREQRTTFLACFLGWSFDAFDFFILVFCLSAIAATFQEKLSAVAEANFLTLAFRPIGAYLFGRMADRWGRRPTLIFNIASFSILEFAAALAPSLRVFLILRACFGIAMGGEWGVGAALAFETLPRDGRGFFSGILQEGYVAGYLMAGLAYGTLFRHIGWRGMFIVGAIPALAVIPILLRVKESPAWLSGEVRRKTEGLLSGGILKHFKSFLYLVVLMFALNLFSHGTQDPYPTFLEKNHGVNPEISGLVAIVYSVGAILGGITLGAWSERIGRRRTVLVAALVAIPMIPLWAFSHTVPMLALGVFLMQFVVQGAWGVIPAHLNELSPPSVRATFPGLTYQLGNFLAARSLVIQARLAERHFGGNFAPVLAWTAVTVAVLVVVVTICGKEAKGADLSSTI